jgi:hypothetical protein
VCVCVCVCVCACVRVCVCVCVCACACGAATHPAAVKHEMRSLKRRVVDTHFVVVHHPRIKRLWPSAVVPRDQVFAVRVA